VQRHARPHPLGHDATVRYEEGLYCPRCNL
jgi:hypothetical protein